MTVRKQHIAVVLGTRPEYLKLAPVVAELARYPDELEADVVLTGQHRELLVGLADLFDLGNHHQLAVHNDKPDLPALTSALISALDGEFRDEKYDAVIVQGDTTTALCAALAAFYHHIPVAHVEAGLRTDNLEEPFPEELNRQLISRLAHWNFVPTEAAHRNLTREGVSDGAIELTGNTIIDTLHYVRDQKIPEDYEHVMLERDAPELAAALRQVRAAGGRTMALLTVHRRENHGPKLSEFFQMMRALAEEYPDHHLIYPYHLNPEVKGKAFEFMAETPNIHLIPPLSYRPFLYLMSQVDFAMSDSGGLQEEFPTFAKPLLVLRDVTERPEVVDARMGKLVGVEPQAVHSAAAALIAAARTQTAPEWFAAGPNPYGDGLASQRIVARMLRDLQARAG